MRVQLNENGTLTVTAESPIEIYALRCWADNYFGGECPIDTGKVSLVIDASVQPKGSSTFKADPKRDATPIPELHGGIKKKCTCSSIALQYNSGCVCGAADATPGVIDT